MVIVLQVFADSVLAEKKKKKWHSVAISPRHRCKVSHLLQIRIGLQLTALLVPSGPEEAVAQDHIFNIPRSWVVEHILVDEEKDRQVDILVGEQPLLLKAKALNLGKVRRNLQDKRDQIMLRRKETMCD